MHHVCTALCLDRARISIVPVYLALEAAGGVFVFIISLPPFSRSLIFKSLDSALMAQK